MTPFLRQLVQRSAAPRPTLLPPRRPRLYAPAPVEFAEPSPPRPAPSVRRAAESSPVIFPRPSGAGEAPGTPSWPAERSREVPPTESPRQVAPPPRRAPEATANPSRPSGEDIDAATSEGPWPDADPWPEAPIPVAPRAEDKRLPLERAIAEIFRSRDVRETPGEAPRESAGAVTNITIGRIELTALPPAPTRAAAPSRAAGPKGPMSLDEYLHRRDRRPQ